MSKQTETTMTIKAFTNAEKISFNVLDKLKISDMKEFKMTQLVVFETLRAIRQERFTEARFKRVFLNL
jgi:hypothetical protein